MPKKFSDTSILDASFYETSVTVDEAVAILLGIVRGPVRYTCSNEDPTDEEAELVAGMRFCLRDFLSDKETDLQCDVESAKEDKLPKNVIDEQRAALHEFRKSLLKAKAFLCDVNDELSKNQSSALRVDKVTGESRITLSSLRDWAQERYGVSIMPLDSLSASTAEPQSRPATKMKTANPVARQRLRDQERAILAEMEKRGHVPNGLPKNESGKPGIKADIRAILQGTELFSSSKVFDKAWERLRQAGDIAELA